MPRPTPTIPPWIRTFSHPGYINVYSLHRLEKERKLFCTETLFGDWDAPTLLLAKDAAPVHVIRTRVERSDADPWRHGVRGRDPMGYLTNERVTDIAGLFKGSKLYGSALAHMLKESEQTSGSLADFYSGPLHDHLKCVLEFVVDNMCNLEAIVCLGNEAYSLVSTCVGTPSAAALLVGQCMEVELFKRRVLLAKLYHPSRPFAGGWAARREEWGAVARQINRCIANS
jgi:hypothetical protein